MDKNIQQGRVFHLANCPGLHGHKAKPRWVVVAHPPDKITDEKILVICCSRSSLSAYKVPLPNREDDPSCRSGLPHRCSAVCDEPKLVPRSDLDDYRGRLTAVTTNRVVAMTRKYFHDQKNFPAK